MNTNTPDNLLWDDSPIDVSAEVNFIWSIANKLRGTYSSDKYKNVIIPMTIIRRIECALEPTKDNVVHAFLTNEKLPGIVAEKMTGYKFYNKSKFTLANLLNDPDHLAENFKAYINGFSENVQAIIYNIDFIKEIGKLNKSDRLFNIIKAFSEIDLNPKTIDNVKMGYIFEELIRKFSENAEAGDHYTGRDIIKLMVSIVLAEGCEDLTQKNKVITILDQACGTGGMLSTAYNYIKHVNPEATVKLFGQEINPESFAICMAEMLIKGQDAENIRLQDTLKEDCFPRIKMRFVLENPPFGTKWGGKDAPAGVETAVKEEYLKINSRWPAGLPATGDAQMLFLQSAMDKLDDTVGRAAIIENGSPLFTGNTGSGESQIRRWLLDNDYLEAIIALPTDLFYNTGIATYIWVLSKNKRAERKGKVQLIDATNQFEKLRKSLGKKRNEISPNNRVFITELYTGFAENEYCKIFDNDDFKYREYTVMQPLQRNYAITKERIDALQSNGAFSSLYDEYKRQELENKEELNASEKATLEKYIKNQPVFDAVIAALNNAANDTLYKNPDSFEPVLNEALKPVNELLTQHLKKSGVTTLTKKIMHGLSVMDKTADIQTDKKGNVLYDPETKDIELVPYQEDIDTYMQREVLPHVPDAKAFLEEKNDLKKTVVKTGAEIPFTRYFYNYEPPVPSETLKAQFLELEQSVSQRIAALFK